MGTDMSQENFAQESGLDTLEQCQKPLGLLQTGPKIGSTCKINKLNYIYVSKLAWPYKIIPKCFISSGMYHSHMSLTLFNATSLRV